MKKTFKALKCSTYLYILLIVFTSCNEEFAEIQSDVLGENNFNFNTESSDIPIKAYNENLETLQVNNLSSNLLGVFNDLEYGRTTASVVTQVTPTTFNPNDFGSNPEIESVTLTLPYFSTPTSTNSEGVPVFRLDSLFVKENRPENTGSFKLTIYQNNFFLRNFDPNSSTSSTQNYYSNAKSSMNSVQITGSTINFDDHIGRMLYQDDDFLIESAAISTVTGTGEDEVTTFSRPAIKIDLLNDETDKEFWEGLLFLDEDQNSVLSSADEFREYFRGLYFKVEPNNNDGAMVLLNFLDDTDGDEANIVVNYSRDNTNEGGERVENQTFTLNFSGNRLNTFINEFNAGPLPVTPNIDDGDERLFLKGTEGAMGVIELFDGLVDCDGDGQVDDDALECFKSTYRKTDADGNFIVTNGRFELKRLINEAQLVIYEDDDLINPDDNNGDAYHTYDRLYIYDLANNSPIIDYSTDPTINTAIPLLSRSFSLGLRRPDSDNEDKAKYKLSLTGYLNNILTNESIDDITEFKLGLVSSINVNIANNNDLLNRGNSVTGVPSITAITPRGTIVYGTNISDPDKKMRLRLFFTELNP